MISKLLAFADVYTDKIMGSEISLGSWRIWRPKLSLTPAAGLTFFPDMFLTQSYFADCSMSFISLGDFSLSPEHVAIQQTAEWRNLHTFIHYWV